MEALQVFDYDGQTVRTVQVNGEPWFVLKDVCAILGIGTPARVSERLDEDEVSLTHLTDSLKRQQNTTVISESGLYNVVLRSDKPEAKPFRRWVTHEVLPALRKTGAYSVSDALPPRPLTTDDYLTAAGIVARSSAQRLPYVLHLLSCAGLHLPEPEKTDTEENEGIFSLSYLAEVTKISYNPTTET